MTQEERLRFYAKLLVEYIDSLDRSNPMAIVAAIDGFEAGLQGGTYLNLQTAFGPLPDDAIAAKAQAYVEGRKYHTPAEGDNDI